METDSNQTNPISEKGVEKPLPGTPSKVPLPSKIPEMRVKMGTLAPLENIPLDDGSNPFKVHSKKRPADDSTRLIANVNSKLKKPQVAKAAEPTKRPSPTLPTKSLSRVASRSVSNLKPSSRVPPKTTVVSRPTRPVTKAASKPPVPSSSAPPPAKKKRPAYDTKGRLEDLEKMHKEQAARLNASTETVTELSDKLRDSLNTINELMQFRNNLEMTVTEKEKEKEKTVEQLTFLSTEKEAMIAKHTEEVNAMKNAHDQIKNTLDNEILILKKKLESVESELNYSKQENGHMKSTIQSAMNNKIVLEMEINSLKSSLEESLNLGTLQKQEIETLQKTNEGLQKNIEDLEEKLRNDEVIRKQLHNTIQELKGNIRVFCRVRPLLPSEQEDISQSLYQVTIPEGTENRIDLIQTLENATGDKKLSKTFDFNFDKVFEPKSTQEQVFSEISQLVQSALDGYNVCIFAYGQTGTGKTFTMEGPSGNADESQAGMIPRAVSQIFNAAESLTEKGWKYELQAQYLEIYNEELRDLLSDSSDSPKKLDIKHHLNRTTVTDIVLKSVKSPKEVYKLLEQASSNRAVASTNCNERSSRSHSVFTLKLSGTNSITEESVSSVLNLIDLAGSERLSSSGSTGERLKETQAINKSLSSLGDVIVALAGKQSHIPYRNSKLTYLLQHSLGGNSKTLMFVNVSPVPASFNETLCSLRFAKKVNACEIGTARKQANVKPTELLKS